MKITYLREFAIIASSGSIQKASQKLFLSPSTLGKHLADIENAIGTELLERTTNTYQLTRAGEKFLEYAISIYSLYDKALLIPTTEEYSYPSVTVGGHLQCSYLYRLFMNTSSYIAHHLCPVIPIPLTKHYAATIPTLVKINPIDDLSMQRYDIAMVFSSNMHPFEEFATMHIGEEHYSIAVPQQHPLAMMDSPIDIAELEKYRITVSQAYPAIWRRFDEYCALSGLSPTIKTRTYSTGGGMFASSNDNDVILVARQDSHRIAPTSISGLVVKDLDDSLSITANAVWNPAVANKGVAEFLACLENTLSLIKR